jgi:hypothetical protein
MRYRDGLLPTGNFTNTMIELVHHPHLHLSNFEETLLRNARSAKPVVLRIIVAVDAVRAETIVTGAADRPLVLRHRASEPCLAG